MTHAATAPAADPAFVLDHYPAARRSLRIAYVTETWPPEVNGVATTVAQFVAGLQARNHDVQLVRPRQQVVDARHDPDAQGTAADPELRFHEVLMRGLPIPRYPNLRMGMPARRALVQLWSLRRPDIVHIATEGPLGWSALQAALHLKLPVCSDFRTNFHAYSRHYGLGWLRKPIMAYLRKFHNRTACTMVPTDALRQDLEACGFKRLSVVTRGVDTQRFAPAHRSDALRASWGAGPDDLVVNYVGRLAAEKNLAVLSRAIEAITQARPGARCVLVGDGPQRAELQARHPLVVFAGQRRGDELAAHYASADLFLFPSLTETYGNVTPEAMASGLAVVAFDDAAAAQLIRDGVNGALAPADDPQGFVARAVALAVDDQARRTCAARARATAETLAWDGVVTRFESVLLEALRNHGEPMPAGMARVRSAPA